MEGRRKRSRKLYNAVALNQQIKGKLDLLSTPEQCRVLDFVRSRMVLRLSREDFGRLGHLAITLFRRPGSASLLLALVALNTAAFAQSLIKAPQGEPITLIPADMAVLEAPQERKDLPCVVTPHKSELGFDLRFHAGYDVALPLRELEGDSQVLTIIFRVYPEGDKDSAAYFSQRINVPAIDDDAKGDAMLQGAFDLGQGSYHVDWMMRDRSERPCSSSWDTEAALGPKDGSLTPFIRPKAIAEAQFEPFRDEPVIRPANHPDGSVNVKLLVNFSPESKDAATLAPVDLTAILGILKTIEHDPRVSKVSLVAFNVQEHRILYRQEAEEKINFPALGTALQTMRLGTIALQNLSEKHGDSDFLDTLIAKEVGGSARPDAVIFAGPKAMLDSDVPEDDIRRIGDIECPVFYMNYNPNPQTVPWKDSISHAVRVLKGTEFTISRPRDVWFATSEMLSRAVRSKRIRSSESLVGVSSSR